MRIFFISRRSFDDFSLIEMFSASVQAATLEKLTPAMALSPAPWPRFGWQRGPAFEKHGLDLNLVCYQADRAASCRCSAAYSISSTTRMPALEAYQRGNDTALIASR
jgi:hypothetical protein